MLGELRQNLICWCYNSHYLSFGNTSQCHKAENQGQVFKLQKFHHEKYFQATLELCLIQYFLNSSAPRRCDMLSKSINFQPIIQNSIKDNRCEIVPIQMAQDCTKDKST